MSLVNGLLDAPPRKRCIASPDVARGSPNVVATVPGAWPSWRPQSTETAGLPSGTLDIAASWGPQVLQSCSPPTGKSKRPLVVETSMADVDLGVMLGY